MEQLQGGNLTVKLDDAQLGKLVRYISEYGGGSYQSHLRKAFLRSLKEQLGFEDTLFTTTKQPKRKAA